MLCQRCHKNRATVRYAEVVNGKVTDLHLCAECLAKQQENAGTGFEISAPATVAERPSRLVSRRRKTRLRRTCRCCGARLADVLDSGSAGCTTCYDVFSDDIEPMLVTIHGSIRHEGRILQVDDNRARMHADLRAKRALLRTALEAEEYEEAAALRDGIREMELELSALDTRQD